MKRILLATLAAAALAGISNPAAARTDFYLNFGPPPVPAYEVVVPPPRVGYVWIPGHWRWHGHRHVWVASYWAPARPGYAYVPARWVDARGRWYFESGYWRRY